MTVRGVSTGLLILPTKGKKECVYTITCTSSFARFARSATSPSFAYVSNPVPDSSLCRAAAPRLRPLQLLLLARLHRFVSTAAELPACIHFSCFSPLTSASVASLDCVRFNWFPIASASAAAPRMRRLQLCSPMIWRPLRLLLPDCVRFGCAAAPRQLFSKIPAMSTILEHSSTQSSRFSKY